MAVSLIGTVVNSCDATTGFNTGGISGDDDFVQGSGAIGLKVSATTSEMYTTSIASGPYNFSTTLAGYHIIMWFNSKSIIDATAGFRIVVGNGTSRGHWNVVPRSFYKGGFVTNVVNTARAFDSIAAGSWTTGGNPGQLTGVTQVGGVLQTPSSIMGSFNNFQLDQMTIGLGLRVDGGSSGTPNTFDTVRTADEDTNFWGWWTSRDGSIVGKGKLFIGPTSGSADSFFTDSAFTVVFADERVATGFYEINTRGAGTEVRWELGAISAASPTNARWSLTLQSDTELFEDTNGVWKGADVITLRSIASLNGTTIINSNSMVLNGATIDNITVLNQSTAEGVAFVLTSDLELITNSSFEISSTGTGHAIQIDTTGSYDFIGNNFTNYGPTEAGFNTTSDVDAPSDAVTITSHGYSTGNAIRYNKHGLTANMGLTDNTTYYVRALTVNTIAFYTSASNAQSDTSRLPLTSTGNETHYINSMKAAIYNNSGGAITINIQDGNTPSIRNSSGSTTVVSNPVAYTLTDIVAGSEVRVFRASDSVELAGIESSSTSFTYNYEYTGDIGIYIIIQNTDYEWLRINDTLGSSNKSQKVFQREDRSYANP